MYRHIQLNKIFSCVVLLLFLISCSIKPKIIKSGIQNLEKKQNQLNVKYSNKNDITSILGETLLKEYPNEQTWMYFEIEKKISLFGKKTIIKNNFLVLEFNTKGILISKNFLDKENLKDFEIDQTVTETLGIRENFSKKFLASLRKRFQNKTNSQANYK